MAKAAKTEKPEKKAKKPEAEAAKPAPKEAKPKLPKSCKAVDVLGKSGELVRTYTLETHGENFAALADQFVTKHGGKAVPAGAEGGEAEAADEAGESEEGEEEEAAA